MIRIWKRGIAWYRDWSQRSVNRGHGLGKISAIVSGFVVVPVCPISPNWDSALHRFDDPGFGSKAARGGYIVDATGSGLGAECRFPRCALDTAIFNAANFALSSVPLSPTQVYARIRDKLGCAVTLFVPWLRLVAFPSARVACPVSVLASRFCYRWFVYLIF
jgi:hypothetical protein